METRSQAARAREIGQCCTRRRLTQAASLGAVAAALASALGAHPASARRRRVKNEHNVRGKKAIMCIDGETKRVPKKKRKQHLKQGATRGACNSCTPVCAPGSCGDDGCGGTCGCAAGSTCVSGTCRVCDVTCAGGDGVACGESLQAAIAAGGNVTVCPGEYVGDFTTPVNVDVTGAGSGDDPASSTILRRATASGATVAVTTAVTTRFASLRVTGGSGANPNSGGVYIQNASANVTLDGVALIGNTGSYGGGASLYNGTLTITGCVISRNTAVAGGGIAVATQTTVESTTISGNTSTGSDSTQGGGGVFVNSGTTNLGSGVTITGNTAVHGGGVFKNQAGAVINNSATVTGNNPDNCAAAPGSTFAC